MTAGASLSPVLAQQVAGRLLPEPIQVAPTAALPVVIDKEVALSDDGSFPVAVLAMDGKPSVAARLRITAQDEAAAGAEALTTSMEGQVRATGLRPGVYQVQAQGSEGTYRGALRVWPAHGHAAVAEIVAITLIPDADSPCSSVDACGQGCGCGGATETNDTAARSSAEPSLPTGPSPLAYSPAGSTLGLGLLSAAVTTLAVAEFSESAAEQQVRVVSP